MPIFRKLPIYDVHFCITRTKKRNLVIIPLKKGKKMPFFDVVRIADKMKPPLETYEKQLFYGVPKSYQYF